MEFYRRAFIKFHCESILEDFKIDLLPYCRNELTQTFYIAVIRFLNEIMRFYLTRNYITGNFILNL